MNTDDNERVRVQIDATQLVVAKLDETGELIGASSRSETVRRAIGLLHAVTNGTREGRTLCFRNRDGTYTEIILC